jgi:hypothetical protein
MTSVHFDALASSTPQRPAAAFLIQPLARGSVPRRIVRLIWTRMAFPRHLLEGLATASAGQLREIEIAGLGTGLYGRNSTPLTTSRD